MAVTTFFVMLLQSIIQYPQLVGEELDEATRERMEERHTYLTHKMAQLLQELEQRSLEQRMQEKSDITWGSLLFAALQYQPFWAIAGLWVLLVGVWWWFRRWSHQADNHSDDSSSGHRDEEEEEEEEEEDNENALGRFIEEHIQLPVRDITTERNRALHLVHTYILIFRELIAGSFYPVPEGEIGVGSAYEGWSLREENTVYRIFVPIMPPRGHAFHLEINTARGTEARTCRIHVELLCTCLRPGDMLCFLHHSAEELRNQEPSLLDTLCTNSFLDVEKTVRWFYQLVRTAWVVFPLSSKYCLKLLPFSRSCRFQVRRNNEPKVTIEMIFGVQVGNSDIFVSSESTEASFTPSTIWSETYAVAEVKFFRLIARKAPRDSFHIKCLQVFAYIYVGSGFSLYTFKTAVMHLLTTIPLSNWRSKYFLQRLKDITSYLRRCLEEKRLNHFFFGNENVPEEILLPSSFRNAVPPNLFHHLAQDPDTLPETLREFYDLQDRLRTFLIFGN